MGKVKNWGVQELADAVVVWTGWGRTHRPQRDDSTVVDHFGSDLAEDLMAAVHELEDEFYSSDARHYASTLEEMAEIAVTQFRANHPEIPEEAVRALAWCYTYDYK